MDTTQTPTKAQLRAAVMTAEVAAKGHSLVSPSVWESDVFNAFHNLRALIDALDIPEDGASDGEGSE